MKTHAENVKMETQKGKTLVFPLKQNLRGRSDLAGIARKHPLVYASLVGIPSAAVRPGPGSPWPLCNLMGTNTKEPRLRHPL